MSKKSPLVQSRHHLMIYDEDWDWLCQAYGPGAPRPIGPGAMIKTVVHAYVMRLKERVNDKLDSRVTIQEIINDVEQ